MKQINIHEAKTNLSKPLKKTGLGEKIIIANRRVPKTILSKYIPKVNLTLDSYAGQIKVSNHEINQLKVFDSNHT